MRNKTINFCLLLGLAFMLLNCTNVIELELPEQEPRLVVNGIFNPDSTWRIEVSGSQSALSDAAYEQVQHAQVELYQGERLLYTLPHAGAGQYVSQEIYPEALVPYTLKVTAPGYPAVQASSFAPAKPVTHTYKARYINTAHAREVEVMMNLDDVPGAQNYYFVSAYYNDTSFAYDQAYKHYISVSIEAPIAGEFSLGRLQFFSDKLIDGKSVTLKFRYDSPGVGKIVNLNVAQVNPTYYHYARTLTKQATVDSFSHTPVAVHNNIQNGFGIFAGHTLSTIKIQH